MANKLSRSVLVFAEHYQCWVVTSYRVHDNLFAVTSYFAVQL